MGSAVLAEALVAGRFCSVQALVAGPMNSTLPHLQALPQTRLQVQPAVALGLDSAIVIFERERHSNRRDDAFTRAEPAALPALARQLLACGVRRLVVVVPHAPALLPHALKAGLASLDEAAIAALGFEHCVFVRSAQDGPAQRGGHAVQRFAHWWLSQLRWMIPQREQPLRSVVLARLAVTLARGLRRAPSGIYVAPQALLWQLAQDADGGEARAAAWLAGTGKAPVPAPG